MTERTLATIRKIAEIKPIENADKIEAARVDGWWVVIKKNDFNVGDLAIYCEIDSFVPTTLAPFLTKPGKTPRVFNDIQGERLKTVRLRGQLSQGLLLPLSTIEQDVKERDDVTELLSIQKWEPVLRPGLRGLAKGIFPDYLRKTDQERIQNIPEVLEDQDTLYEISLKLDGTSITIFVKDGYPGICSRNINMKLDSQNDDNLYVSVARKLGFLDMLLHYYGDTGRSIAIQGELMGPGIQGNYEEFKDYCIFIFDIWDIDNRKYLDPISRNGLASYLYQQKNKLVRHIPVLKLSENILQQGPSFVSLRELKIRTMDDILLFAETTTFPYYKSPIEGLVFKAVDRSCTFKAINNKYLEKSYESNK